MLCHEKVDQSAHIYKYTPTNRKPRNGEMIAMFSHQNTAAKYVKIITTSKPMSSGGPREGNPTAHLKQQHTHTHALHSPVRSDC